MPADLQQKRTSSSSSSSSSSSGNHDLEYTDEETSDSNAELTPKRTRDINQEAPNDGSMFVRCVLMCAIFFCNGYAAEQAFGGLGIYDKEFKEGEPRPVGHWALAVWLLSGAGSMAMAVVTWRSCNIEFGNVDMPTHLAFATAALMSVVMVILHPALCPGWYVERGTVEETVLLNVGRPLLEVFGLCFLTNLRGPAATIPVFVTFLMSCLPSSGGTFGASYTFFLVAVMFLPNFRACYLRDQRLIIWTASSSGLYLYFGCMVCEAINNHYTFVHLLKNASCYVIVGTGALGFVILANRMKRRLPKGLQQCKFVRLGYLRHAVRHGLPIRRRQEMPPEAFGDPQKARVLVVVSHRWLDRYKCDLPGDGAPHGLRLTTLTRRLNDLFPEKVTVRGCREVFDSMRYCGNDVLVFFDFMALPQIGIAPETGELLYRTAPEAEIFYEALPHMGALYTIYPVLIMREVTPGVAPYDASGWCFSEFCSAWLTKQLGKYSEEALGELSASEAFSCVSNDMDQELVDDSREENFRAAFNADLSKRAFVDEHDRQVVRQIVEGNLVIRRLTDAVQQSSVEDVQRLLLRVREHSLHHVLDHGVDASLDTLLHLAARIGKRNIARALLMAGASPKVRNFRGDRPDQCFLVPRCNKAAALCRKAAGHFTF